MSTRRSTAALAAALSAASIVGVAVVAAPAEAKPRRITVSLVDDAFMPKQTMKLPKGSTVTYVWDGDDPHNVTITGPQSFSSRTQTDGRFVVRLTKPGTYDVVCTIHEYAGMTMKIKVAS